MTNHELPGIGEHPPTPSEPDVRDAVERTLDVLRRELRLLQQEVTVIAGHPPLSPAQRQLAIEVREQLIQIVLSETGHMASIRQVEADGWPLATYASEFSRSWLGYLSWSVFPRLIAWKELCLRSGVESLQRGEYSGNQLQPALSKLRGELDELVSLKRQGHRLSDPIPTAKGWL